MQAFWIALSFFLICALFYLACRFTYWLLFIGIPLGLPYLLAGTGASMVVVVILAILVGTVIALKNYIFAMVNNIDFSDRTWEEDPEPAIRSYFFGPGYKQLGTALKAVVELTIDSSRTIFDNLNERLEHTSGIVHIFGFVAGWLYYLFSLFCIYGISTVLSLVFAVIHFSFTLFFMTLYYLLFSILWLTDRLYLWSKKISTICATCHNTYLIPHFKCSNCGRIHEKLVPGPYGIWKHTCLCGEKLPATFFAGRSNLESFCAVCGTSVIASDVRHVTFQLVGGTNVGKTVYLTAFFQQFKEKIENSSVELSIDPQFEPFFTELEEYAQGASCPATAQLNAQMYPVFLDSDLDVRRQFSLYDIAGEMFHGSASSETQQQQQFRHSKGFIFLLDPLSGGAIREEYINNQKDLSDFSVISSEAVADHFINYLIRMGYAKSNTPCTVPISIVITKSDVVEVKRALSPGKLKSLYKENIDNFPTMQQLQDSESRKFLHSMGFGTTIERLELQFSNLHYFPVSAMGHNSVGESFEPWGVLEPVEWMFELADKELYQEINSK